MKSPQQIFQEFRRKDSALGAFNFSNCETLRAIVEAAIEMKTPVIVATSEGESGFVGLAQAVALVRAWRNDDRLKPVAQQIILHFDHGKSFESVKAAIDAGYDSVHFDGSGLELEENIKISKQVVDYILSLRGGVPNEEPSDESRDDDAAIPRKLNRKPRRLMVEGELGYLRGSSAPGQRVELKKEDFTDPETAARFVKETGVDTLAIAIGNIHGISIKGKNPPLDLKRLQEINKVVNIPLVLHGGSGTPEQDIQKAIKLGITKVNVNTELRLAYTNALKQSLTDNPNQTTPYKIMPPVIEAIKQVVKNKIKLFSL